MVESLETFIKTIDSVASPLFIEFGCMAPFLHIVYDDEEGEQHMVMPALHPDKDIAVEMTKMVLEKFNANRYCFIDEAWFLDTADKAVIERAEKIMRAGGGLEDFPERQEALFYCADDASVGFLSAKRLIIREDGQPPRLGELEFDDSKVVEGRWLGLLPKEKASLRQN